VLTTPQKTLSAISLAFSSASLFLIAFVWYPMTAVYVVAGMIVASFVLPLLGFIRKGLKAPFRVVGLIFSGLMFALMVSIMIPESAADRDLLPDISGTLLGIGIIGFFIWASSSVGKAAERKGRSRRAFFWLSLVLLPIGPLLMGIIVATMAPPPLGSVPTSQRLKS